MAELLPRFRLCQERIEDERAIGRAILEVGEVENETGMPLRSSADGHRTDRRRGLPLISRGICGTAPGSDPLGELIRKESRLRR